MLATGLKFRHSCWWEKGRKCSGSQATTLSFTMEWLQQLPCRCLFGLAMMIGRTLLQIGRSGIKIWIFSLSLKKTTWLYSWCNHGWGSSNSASLDGAYVLYLLPRGQPHSTKTYPNLPRHVSLQPLIELKPQAKQWRGWFSVSANVCMLTFPSFSIHCPTGLPFLPWAGQTVPTRLAYPQSPLEHVLDSRSFPHPSASIRTFLLSILFLSGFVLSYCVVLARKLLSSLIN